jgi:hypothetical protein
MSNGGIEKLYFHQDVTAIGVGKEWTNSYRASTINLVARGSATTFQVKLEGLVCGTWCPVQAVVLETFDISNIIDKKSTIYQVDLSGLEGFRCNLTSVSGGDFTIQGFAVN